jgi:hypothetical protein
VEKYCTARKVKDDNKHSDYVILTAFPLQQWSQERASLLRYTYIACFVSNFLLLLTPGEGPFTADMLCVSKHESYGESCHRRFIIYHL